MNSKWHKKYIDIINIVLEHLRGIILILVSLVTILGFITGYKYYNYTQEEPQYCATCHLMEDAIKEWSIGKHSNVVCQKCHQLSMLEQNQLLVAYVVRGTQQGFSQTHGRVKTWKGCRNCHEDVLTQGASIAVKTGHANHVTLKQLDCSVCHKSKLHNFSPSQLLCVSCHKDKGIHGFAGDTATYKDTCLYCHNFTDKKAPGISRERCDNCHKKIPKEGTMSNLKCHQCHQPHKSNKVMIEDCLRKCHKEINKKTVHSVHYDNNIRCSSCHLPHSWDATVKSIKPLCKACHKKSVYETFEK